MSITEYPSQIAPKFTIRFPDGLREEIARLAEKNHRSMRAEIIARLEDSLKSELRVSEQQGDYAVSSVKEEGAVYSSTMNREIMADVIEVVLGELDAQGKTLPPDKMAQLMLLVHDEIKESEQSNKGVDKAKVIRLIKLAS